MATVPVFPMNAEVSTPRQKPSRLWSYVLATVIGIILGLMVQQCADRTVSPAEKERIEWPTPPATGNKTN